MIQNVYESYYGKTVSDGLLDFCHLNAHSVHHVSFLRRDHFLKTWTKKNELYALYISIIINKSSNLCQHTKFQHRF